MVGVALLFQCLGNLEDWKDVIMPDLQEARPVLSGQSGLSVLGSSLLPCFRRVSHKNPVSHFHKASCCSGGLLAPNKTAGEEGFWSDERTEQL